MWTGTKSTNSYMNLPGLPEEYWNQLTMVTYLTLPWSILSCMAHHPCQDATGNTNQAWITILITLSLHAKNAIIPYHRITRSPSSSSKNHHNLLKKLLIFAHRGLLNPGGLLAWHYPNTTASHLIKVISHSAELVCWIHCGQTKDHRQFQVSAQYG